ncbi:MAG: hypothetical protein IJ168_07520 [Eubacterium sp.]|nr:hypothetical protein [Eubacterium sp.]
MAVKTKKKMKKGVKALIIIAAILAVIILADCIAAGYRSDPDSFIYHQHTNPFISSDGSTQISAHRSGGGIAPEESMAAFRNCIENPNFAVDVFEFDLHITKDDVLVLLHDDTLDRTTDAETVFGVKNARPEDYTYEELRQLNIGAHFVNNDGETPYAELSEVPEELRIVRLETVLDYLESNGHFDYIIELKNGGELGQKGVDVLYRILTERGLLDHVVFGTFQADITEYVDENYPDMNRSASIKEVLAFYGAAMTGKDSLSVNYQALQIPYNMPYRLIVNLGTTKVINYAHEHDIAVQYWTINDPDELEYLCAIGADCIMTDYPDELYAIANQ